MREVYRDENWGHWHSELLGDRSEFTGPHPGPLQRYTRNVQQPIYFFNLFWDTHTMQVLVGETNRYARHARAKKPHLTNGGVQWYDTDEQELRAWLGLCILMGQKLTPCIRDYWKRDKFFRCAIIPKIMKRDRFEALLRCLHCVDNQRLVSDKNHSGYDKIAKVRWVLEGFVRRSRELYNPEKFLTTDEIMVAYRGKYSPIRQYIKSKPTRYGLKFWALVCSQTRYIYNLIPYLGKSGQVEPTTGESVVLDLIAGLEGRGHTVVCDNFFSSPSLFHKLLDLGTWATGTISGPRIGFPAGLLGFKRGQYEKGTMFWQIHRDRQMGASTWFDSKPVTFLSTSSNPIAGVDVTCRRWRGGESREEVRTTPQQVEYQKNMRGVDVVDQMRWDYTVQFHSRKWWHKVFMFVLDSSLQNMWTLWQGHMQGRRAAKVGSRLSFYHRIAYALIEHRMPLLKLAHLRIVTRITFTCPTPTLH